jgi:hypothetical protein
MPDRSTTRGNRSLHKTTRDEEDGKTYEYDAEGHRLEI